MIEGQNSSHLLTANPSSLLIPRNDKEENSSTRTKKIALRNLSSSVTKRNSNSSIISTSNSNCSQSTNEHKRKHGSCNRR